MREYVNIVAGRVTPEYSRMFRLQSRSNLFCPCVLLCVLPLLSLSVALLWRTSPLSSDVLEATSCLTSFRCQWRNGLHRLLDTHHESLTAWTCSRRSVKFALHTGCTRPLASPSLGAVLPDWCQLITAVERSRGMGAGLK